MHFYRITAVIFLKDLFIHSILFEYEITCSSLKCSVLPYHFGLPFGGTASGKANTRRDQRVGKGVLGEPASSQGDSETGRVLLLHMRLRRVKGKLRKEQMVHILQIHIYLYI